MKHRVTDELRLCRAWAMRLRCTTLLGLMLAVSTAAGAADVGPDVEMIVVGSYQTTGNATIDGQSVDDEASGAIDLSMTLPLAVGSVGLEVKGSTTPINTGVTSVLAEANALVGETLDNNDNGRIVAWQLFYGLEVGPGELAVGLIDPTVYLDTNDVANSEFTQFIGASFVNDLDIDFPSPSLALVYSAELTPAFALTALVANATGIEPDYQQGFEIGRSGHGTFAALELKWSAEPLSANLGAWINTRHQDEDGDGIDDARLSDDDATGVYGNLSGALGGGQWNLRLGASDGSVQPVEGFAALAYAYPLRHAVLGVGVAHTFASHDLADPHEDIDQAEVYVRFALGKGFTITPDLQYVVHSDFNPEQSGDWVGGVRVGWTY